MPWRMARLGNVIITLNKKLYAKTLKYLNTLKKKVKILSIIM